MTDEQKAESFKVFLTWVDSVPMSMKMLAKTWLEYVVPNPDIDIVMKEIRLIKNVPSDKQSMRLIR